MAVVDWRVDFEGDSCVVGPVGDMSSALWRSAINFFIAASHGTRFGNRLQSRLETPFPGFFFCFFFHATGFEGETPERMPSGPWQTKIKNKTKTNRFPSRRRASADSTKRPQESPRTVVTWKSTLESVWDSTLTRRCVSAAKCVENGNVGSSRL